MYVVISGHPIYPEYLLPEERLPLELVELPPETTFDPLFEEGALPTDVTVPVFAGLVLTTVLVDAGAAEVTVPVFAGAEYDVALVIVPVDIGDADTSVLLEAGAPEFEVEIATGATVLAGVGAGVADSAETITGTKIATNTNVFIMFFI